jgi:ligand-binding sensor domain-containing protein/signal transduction histidine kinase/DNA-binding response OmpR family regulator
MRYYCVLFISLFLTLLCRADDAGQYYFRHYSNKDGLSHNTVYCSLQDKRGFMWFGTDDGLNRFDGYNFQVYRFNNRSVTNDGLPNDRISYLFEDSSGKIWICTDKGVCYYEYESDAFHPLKLKPDINTTVFRGVNEDGFGNLWLREDNLIVRYSPSNNHTQLYTSAQYGFRSVAMTMTEEGVPLFADASSLYPYDYETDTFSRIPILTDREREDETVIQTLCCVPHTGVLIGTNKEGLKMYHSGNGQTETLIPGIFVRAIGCSQGDTYWITSESGVYIYNLADKTLVNLRKSLTSEYSISDNAVYTLTKDREGGIWLGSFFGGISYLPENYKQFNYYIAGKTHPGMLGNIVREICRDKYGNIWMGTEDNGINQYKPATGAMLNFSPFDPRRKLSATNIHGLYADGDILWIGSYNKGIDLLHIPTGKIVKRYSPSGPGKGLISEFVLCFYKTHDGQFLAGTSKGPLLYNKATDSFTRWQGIEDAGLVRQFLQDRSGDLWMASSNGIYRYVSAKDGTPDSMYRYQASQVYARQGIGSNNTTSVFEDSRGNIWVTTSYGFSLYNRKADSFNRITTDDGLPSNFIYRIVEDDDHFFWISTANGLVRFNPDTYAIHTYTHSDGLHETQFNYASSYKADNGVIYMGTVNGMISFDPKQFKTDGSIPPLYITRIHVPGKPKQSFQMKTLLGEEPYLLKLSHNIFTFTLSYIAPNYTSPNAIHYSYMLKGVDKDWIDMGANREVTFAGLPPGTYEFKVRSTNRNSQWLRNEKTLHIIIMPPFWATAWAYVFYILCATGAIFAFYRYKKKGLEKKHQSRQAFFETEKEKELYNAKIQFFTFITHEIRTPLTLITAPLEKIIASHDGTEATRSHLQLIRKNTLRLLQLTNQLLDFRNAEHRGFRLSFCRTDVACLLENILQPFYLTIQKEAKTVSVDLPGQPVMAYIDREIFVKIITNLLTNAIKYSEKNLSIQLLELPEDKKTFAVVMTNDGFLIPEREKENIFTPFYRLKETGHVQGSGIGLYLSRTLAGLHKGTLAYTSTKEGCNQFMLTLPVEQEDYNFPSLTEYPEEDEQAEAADFLPAGNPTLLIVEDQTDMRRFIMEELSTAYHVLEAGNGSVALDILETNNVGIIISDIVMPVMDGFELCNKVKNDIRFCHIPFIILTARHTLQSQLQGLNKGADAYLEKPFTLELLAAQIKNLLKSREMLRRASLEKPFMPIASLATSPLDDLFLQKLNVLIEENLTKDDLTVELIAAGMNMSTSGLYRKVKALSNLSPIDFIRISRLKKAVLLMQQGEVRVNEIAFQVGFSSPAYFSTCFQKQYGKSPTEFIKDSKTAPPA